MNNGNFKDHRGPFIPLRMEKSTFCIQPLEISPTARRSTGWTRLGSLCSRLRCCNFSPRSGWYADAGASSPEIKLSESRNQVGVSLERKDSSRINECVRITEPERFYSQLSQYRVDLFSRARDLISIAISGTCIFSIIKYLIIHL